MIQPFVNFDVMLRVKETIRNYFFYKYFIRPTVIYYSIVEL